MDLSLESSCAGHLCIIILWSSLQKQGHSIPYTLIIWYVLFLYILRLLLIKNICLHIYNTIYLANGLHKAQIKWKISNTVFHAWRNHQGEVVVVAGVCLLLYKSLVSFYIMYSEGRGGLPGHLRSWRSWLVYIYIHTSTSLWRLNCLSSM